MTPKPTTKQIARSFNKPAYAGFVLAGIYFLIVKDFSQAAIFCGLALIFDPFNQETPFAKRPVYQQVWLYVHLAVTILLFVLMLRSK